MQRFNNVFSLQNFLSDLRRSGGKIALVPTMGALHAGHLDLVDAARESGREVIVSIFVNPMQFAPGEDFTAYPRNFERDAALLEKQGATAVFIPSAEDIVSPEHVIMVDPGHLAEGLCGRFRPGHFRGVCTIVSKLFNIVSPDSAYFGWKDAQQFIILRRMVSDLSYPVEMFGVETRRENDGLAMSSRNAYLADEERKVAPRLYEILQFTKQQWEGGTISTAELEFAGSEMLIEAGFRPQYFSLVDTESLQPLSAPAPGNSLLAVAAYLGKTRLIDNLRF